MAEGMDQHLLVKLSYADYLRLEDRVQDIRGLDVYDRDGKEIGSVEDLYVDTQGRNVGFLDIGASGFLGIGKKHFMIPVEAVTEIGEEGVTIEQGREKVTGSPPFDTDVVTRADYQQSIYDHFGYPYPRGRRDEPRKTERASDEVTPSPAWTGGHGGRNRQGDDRPRAPRFLKGKTRGARAVAPIGTRRTGADSRAVERVLEGADELIVEAMNEHALPGLGVGIVNGSGTVYAKGFGLADIERGRPVTQETVFRIGSITKTMTAIGLMQLWERGEFRLDDPINDYLEDLRVEHLDLQAPPITFRHMLTHTSGLVSELRKVTDLFRPMIGFGTKPEQPAPSPEDYYAGGLRAKVYPGTKWAYSNHAFNVVGQLVADISDEAFAEYMRENVFEVLGMKNADYLRSERVGEGLAQGYRSLCGRLKPVKYLEIVVRGAGSVFSSLEDMCRYAAALLGGGANEHGRVLEEETLSLMMEPHFRLEERLPAMGLSFVLNRIDGHLVAGHDGGLSGFVSSMRLAPDSEVGVVALANASFVNAWSMVPHNIADELMRRMLDVPDPGSLPPRRDVPESRQKWPELCGFYGPERGLSTNARMWLMYAGEVEVFVKDDHLAMRTLAGPLRKGVRLNPVDPTDPLAFVALVEDQTFRVVFERDAETDRVDRVCIGFDSLRKRPNIQSVKVRTLAGLGVTVGAVSALAGWRAHKH